MPLLPISVRGPAHGASPYCWAALPVLLPLLARNPLLPSPVLTHGVHTGMLSGVQNCGAAGLTEAFVGPSAVGGLCGSYPLSQIPFSRRRKSGWISFVPLENTSQDEGACGSRCITS